MRDELNSVGDGDSTAGSGAGYSAPRDIHVLLLVILALAVRLWAVLQHSPPFPGDGQVIDSYALRIASGLGFGPSSSIPPLYPYFLGILYRIYGYTPHTVLLSQALIGSLLVVPVVALARIAGLQRRDALLAGLIIAFFPQAVAETRHLTPVLILGLMLSIGVLAWFRRPGIPGIGESLMAGALLGCSILGRTGLIFPVLVLIAVRGIHDYADEPHIGIHRIGRHAPFRIGNCLDLWMRRGFLLIAAFCVIAPWTVRSSRLHGHPVFVESTWGLRLRAANVPDMPVARYSLPGAEARAPDNMVLTENRIAFQDFLGYAATHPGRLASVWSSRITRFFAFSPMSDSGSTDPFPYRLHWFRLFQALFYGTVLTLALSWLVLQRGAGGIERALALLIVSIMAVGVVTGRMGDARLLSLPFIAVLAGRGLAGVALLGRVGMARRIAFLCLLVALWIQGLRAGGLL